MLVSLIILLIVCRQNFRLGLTFCKITFFSNNSFVSDKASVVGIVKALFCKKENKDRSKYFLGMLLVAHIFNNPEFYTDRNSVATHSCYVFAN